jgi:hypothetical protein
MPNKKTQVKKKKVVAPKQSPAPKEALVIPLFAWGLVKGDKIVGVFRGRAEARGVKKHDEKVVRLKMSVV